MQYRYKRWEQSWRIRQIDIRLDGSKDGWIRTLLTNRDEGSARYTPRYTFEYDIDSHTLTGALVTW